MCLRKVKYIIEKNKKKDMTVSNIGDTTEHRGVMQ